MRVLHLVQKPQRRGAETFAFQLGDALNASGHEVASAYLYPFTGTASLPLRTTDQCLEGDEGHVLERVPGFHPLLLRKVRRAIGAFRPHVVQANGARTVKYGALCRGIGHPGWRLVYRNIGDPETWLRTRRHRLFYRALMSRVDGVVGVSSTTLGRVEAFYNLGVPTRSIPRAISPEALVPHRDRLSVRNELNTAVDDPVMIFVGTLSPEKRLDRLLRVAATVRRSMPAAVLWIVGDGSLREDLEVLAAEQGVLSRTRFAGARGDVASYIAAADLLVLTSDTEGVPGVVLEAGWLERPVVATDVGGVHECLVDGETGTLVDPADEDAFANAAVRLLEDPLRRDAMGRHAHAWIDEHFRIDRITRQYVEFYEQVLAR